MRHQNEVWVKYKISLSNQFLFVAVPAEPNLSVLNTTRTSISVSLNRGACSSNLQDNQGVALTLELLYGVNDVCDTVGFVSNMYLEGERVSRA